jgi:hypothetical protein
MVAVHGGDVDRTLKRSAVLFAIGFGIHGVDHMIRGMSASPLAVMIGGYTQGVFVIIALAMVLTGRYRAPEMAVGVGFGSGALFTYAHLLPTFWADFQDSFVTGPRINVTWFSWLSAVAEIGTGIVFGLAGLRALRRRTTDAAPLESGAASAA